MWTWRKECAVTQNGEKMSDLYLCISEVSTTPYYLSGLCVNIYSMDELCFYLVQNAFILDNDLIDTALCDYIENHLKMPELSKKLRKMIFERQALGELVTTILTDTGYLGEEEIKSVRKLLVDNASLSFEAKRKARGDNLYNAGKYSRAIEEYQYVLNILSKDEEPALYSQILHNVGSSYAQQYLFDKAAKYYKMAYETDENEESLKHYLTAKRLCMRKTEFERLVVKDGYNEDIVKEVLNEIDETRNLPMGSEYKTKLIKVRDIKEEGRIGEYYDAVDELIGKFKNDYRQCMDVG